MTSFILCTFFLLTCIWFSTQKIAPFYSYGHDKLKIEEIFKFDTAQNTLTVDAKYDHYPLELGKALAYLAREFSESVVKLDLRHGANPTPKVIFKQPQDQFFIWNNLERPLPAPANHSYFIKDNITIPKMELLCEGKDQNQDMSSKFKAPTPKLIVEILNKQLALSQIASLSSSGYVTCEEKIVMNLMFTQTVIFPKCSQRVNEVCDSSSEQTVDFLQRQINDAKNSLLKYTRFETTFQSEISESTNKFIDFTNSGLGSVIYDQDLIFVDENVDYAYLPILAAHIEPVDLSFCEVLYAQTDESFTLWLSDKFTAYLVDAGSLFLSQGLKALVKNSQDVRNIHVTVTHFHLDHIQALAPFIVNSASDTTTVHLYIPEGLVKGFFGWYIQFNKNMSVLLEQGSLTIQIVSDQSKTEGSSLFGQYQTNFAHSWRLSNPPIMKHIVTNVSPVITIDDTAGHEKYMIVAGDLEPYGVGPQDPKGSIGPNFTCPWEPLSNENNVPHLFDVVVAWLTQVLEFANITTGSLDLYIYTGIFTGTIRFECYEDDELCLHPENLYDYVKYKISQQKTTKDIHLSIIETHVKDLNFNSKIHSCFT